MAAEITTFRYAGRDAAGGREREGGTKSFAMYTSDAVISTVQVFPKGTGNSLHSHAAQDGYWLVLAGRAKFLGEGGVVLADLGRYEGAFVPHGTRYWFECAGEEPLEILRVSMNLPGHTGGGD